MKPKMISIIVPIYNVGEYLSRCIKSIINQTYYDIEIILIDDGSTDDSINICKEYANKDKRIVLIRQKNQGLVAARKAGLSIASGEYIGFVDGDDYIEPNMYESLVYLIEKNKVDFVHSGYYKNEIQYNTPKRSEIVLCEAMQQKEYILRRMIFDQTNSNSITPSIWSKLYKRDIITKAYMEIDNSNTYGEDLLCLCNCIRRSSSFYVDKGCYYHYVIRESSICNQKGSITLTRETELYKALMETVGSFYQTDEINSGIEHYLIKGLTLQIDRLTTTNIPVYQIDNIKRFFDKKIILYGAGKVGQDYYSQLSLYERCNVVAWIDKNSDKYAFDYYSVKNTEEILNVEYDYVFIAVLNERLSDCIKDELIKMGIDKNKIVWQKPVDIY